MKFLAISVKCLLIFHLVISVLFFLQFIVIASCIGYSIPTYGNKAISSGGEAIGWLIVLTPIVITVAFAIFHVLKEGRPSKGNILSQVKYALYYHKNLFCIFF